MVWTRLLISEFREQNIVHQIRILGQNTSRADLRNALARLLFDIDPDSQVLEPALATQLDENAKGVLAGQKVIVEIEPVYGASVLLIASGVQWLRSPDESPTATSQPAK